MAAPLGRVAVLIHWVTKKVPSDFGSLRSRWPCAVLALLLRERWGVQASRETVRRMLHRENMVYRRPRPVRPPNHEQRQVKLGELRKLLENLPENETVVWRDEVEIHSNPKLGRMWMFKGRQEMVQTPDTNQERHLPGSIHWRTGRVFITEAVPKQGRNSALFLHHLDDRRRRLRRYKKIHVIRGNAGFHTSHEVVEYLWDHDDRIEVHLLPSYAPDYNPIERACWHLHENITRNHRCKDLGELLDRVFAWLEQGNPFQIEGSLDPKAKAA